MISAAQKAVLEELLARLGGRGELLTERMGIEIVDPDPQHLVATMPVAGNRQVYGLLHGGASAVLAETIGSIAASLLAGPDNTAVGIELNCSHHRSATEGLVTGVSTPIRVGRTLSTFDIRITDGDERLVCTARLTCAIRPASAAGLSPS